MSDLAALTAQILAFRDARNWSQFHTPKDLAAALAIEASELQEIFLWQSPEQVAQTAVEKKEHLADELSDIAAYLFLLADRLDIDLATAIPNKLAKNAQKYPVEKAKGRSTKYTEL